MKVIFLQNIEDYKVGEIKEVSEGYARNFLFRRGFAEIATEGKVKEIEGRIEKIKKEESGKVKDAKKIAEKISSKKFLLVEEVNEEGHLYGAVGVKEIADLISTQEKIEVDGGDILIEEPIKELGKHEIIVKLGHGVETRVKIEIKRTS